MTQGRSFHENYPGTAWLLLAIIAFFALEVVGQHQAGGGLPGWMGVDWRVVHTLGLLDPSAVRGGEYWRLIACAFIHLGILHVLFSAWVLYDVGRLCEPLLSTWKFLAVYTASAAGGSLASFANLTWIAPGGASAGASGAISGLIGLLLVYSIRRRHPELRDSLIRWVLLIVVLSVLAETGGVGIDHAAHLGGFIVGGLFGLTVRDYIPSHAARRWRLPGYAAAAVLAAGAGTGLWRYFLSE